MTVPSSQMDLVGRWWNGRFGWNRRDIWLYGNGIVWRVEAHESTRKGDPWRRDHASEHEARALVETMLARSGDQWRDIIGLYERKPPLAPA